MPIGKLRGNKLRHFGHVTKRKETKLVRAIMGMNIEGRREENQKRDCCIR